MKEARRAIGAEKFNMLKPGTSLSFKAGWRQPMTDVVVLTDPKNGQVSVRELPTQKNPNPSVDSIKTVPSELFERG